MDKCAAPALALRRIRASDIVKINQKNTSLTQNSPTFSALKMICNRTKQPHIFTKNQCFLRHSNVLHNKPRHNDSSFYPDINTCPIMPELTEQMYCSQQICIPPTFPYLLRQFAKAAIRTQPNDLLKWSTTYFRCLSLNIPPPVKPRLEYPIPRDHNGMTPGWLRALLHQMQGAPTVSFKVLWDRWIGACLQHPNLIQILCLGGFDDSSAIPWMRFIALCAAHLTDSLTQSMIVICEILTEEPEGGSAMIPVQVFIDLYQFLAQIDASHPQTLRNYYFLDKFLELYQEKIARDQGVVPAEEEVGEASFSIVSSEETMKTEKETRKDDGTSVVSCPSVSSQDPDNFMKLLMKLREGDEGEDLELGMQAKEEESIVQQKEEAAEEKKRASQASRKVEIEDETKKESARADAEQEEEAEKMDRKSSRKSSRSSRKSAGGGEADITIDQEDTVSRDTKVSSIKKDFRKCPEEGKDEDTIEQEYILQDLERLKLVQHELMGGESDDELEKFKASILADAAMTESEVVAPEHFQEKIDLETESMTETVKSNESTMTEPSVKEKPFEEEYEEVFVEAVPGIGPKVPEELVTAVRDYMTKVAKWQHNMVMPRNIRHFECPPLEVANI